MIKQPVVKCCHYQLELWNLFASKRVPPTERSFHFIFRNRKHYWSIKNSFLMNCKTRDVDDWNVCDIRFLAHWFLLLLLLPLSLVSILLFIITHSLTHSNDSVSNHNTYVQCVSFVNEIHPQSEKLQSTNRNRCDHIFRLVQVISCPFLSWCFFFFFNFIPPYQYRCQPKDKPNTILLCFSTGQWTFFPFFLFFFFHSSSLWLRWV